MGSTLSSATKIGISVSEFTLPCVGVLRDFAQKAGFALCEFDASRAGGRALEAELAAGRLAGVIDLTLTELAYDQLAGRSNSDRLTAAGLHGIPQVIVPGGLDAIVNDSNCVERISPSVQDRIGQEIGFKASAARGPTVIVFPLLGISSIALGGSLANTEKPNDALFQSIRNWISPQASLIELELHINDPAFVEVVWSVLLYLIGSTVPPSLAPPT